MNVFFSKTCIFVANKHKMMITAKEIINYMESMHNEEQRQALMRFFKTGPGEFGEGDEMPEQERKEWMNYT